MNSIYKLRVASKAVVESDNQILILQPSKIDQNKKWHIPGGIRDNINEPLKQTAIREVAEETGLNLEGLPTKVVYASEWKAKDKGEEVNIVAIFFHFKLPTRQNVNLSEEHKGYAWINKQNIENYVCTPEVIEILDIVLNPSPHYAKATKWHSSKRAF